MATFIVRSFVGESEHDIAAALRPWDRSKGVCLRFCEFPFKLPFVPCGFGARARRPKECLLAKHPALRDPGKSADLGQHASTRAHRQTVQTSQ